MRYSAIALLLSAASSQAAYDYTWDVSAASENDGAATRISWSFTGSLNPVFSGLPPGNPEAPGMFFGGNNSGLVPFSTLPPTSSFLVGSTGIWATNPRTLETVEIKSLRLRQLGSSSFLQFAFVDGQGATGGILIQNGDTLNYTVPASGSFVINQDFSLFNLGYWATDGGVTRTSLTIGTPVPEPSTYGLILGGLALAGAAIRRRQRAK